MTISFFLHVHNINKAELSIVDGGRYVVELRSVTNIESIPSSVYSCDVENSILGKNQNIYRFVTELSLLLSKRNKKKSKCHLNVPFCRRKILVLKYPDKCCF
mgnify:CR=1 FL=1